MIDGGSSVIKTILHHYSVASVATAQSTEASSAPPPALLVFARLERRLDPLKRK